MRCIEIEIKEKLLLILASIIYTCYTINYAFKRKSFSLNEKCAIKEAVVGLYLLYIISFSALYLYKNNLSKIKKNENNANLINVMCAAMHWWSTLFVNIYWNGQNFQVLSCWQYLESCVGYREKLRFRYRLEIVQVYNLPYISY